MKPAHSSAGGVARQARNNIPIDDGKLKAS
jgi:hypothetical protein